MFISYISLKFLTYNCFNYIWDYFFKYLITFKYISNSQDLRRTSFCPLIWTYYSFDILAYYIVGKQAYLDVENE